MQYPVDEIIQELKNAVLRHSSVILQAPPGAGKTTRVPLALLDDFKTANRIIMLEPRRLAAVSAARWMAHILGEQVGQTVGYSIRFDSRISHNTRIEVVTEGILTRRIQSDPGLEGVAMIIFDEFHERSLNADLSLALCIDIQRSLRGDMKIMIMSATIDTDRIAKLLGDAPVISSPGRVFPVKERYLAVRQEKPLSKRIADAVAIALKEAEGDVLVFLPGAGEIRQCAELLKTSINRKDISVHALYGDLPFDEQESAITPADRRKIVLATNIAETSLTIEGVGIVIDSGLTRRLQHDPSVGMNRLITTNVSKASAEQRKGRAGRLGPGVCYRMYSSHFFQSLIPFSPPEILTSDLSSLVLELAVWGVKDFSMLLWLDSPPVSAWKSARDLLEGLGAIERSGSITEMGRAMVRLPLHVRLGRLLLRSAELHCLRLGSDLAAIISERDMMRSGTINRTGFLKDTDISERIEILGAWRNGREIPQEADTRALQTIDRTSAQLTRLMNTSSKSLSSDREMPDLLQRLLISAFPDRIAKMRKDMDGRFMLSQGRGVHLPAAGRLARCPYIVAVNLDAGQKSEGIVHMAEPLSEEIIRQECRGRISTVRRVQWSSREERITGALEERLGSVFLSSKPFDPADEESLPLLCEAITRGQAVLTFGRDARQFQGRVSLISRAYPEETWPDLSDDHLLITALDWLAPWVGGLRCAADIARLDVLPALRAQLTWKQQQLLDDRAPSHMAVPSGSSISIDYTSGGFPVLAVKLQEMFGLADTPIIAGGRIRVLLHLLSPARRPVQITHDLKGFWNNSYLQVKKELKGRYPKHPWPDDPWNAVPTRKIKIRN